MTGKAGFSDAGARPTRSWRLHARGAHRPGITMIELIVTIVIMLLLVGTAIGAVKGISSWRRTGGAKRLIADLSYVRDLALLTRCRTIWVFDSPTQAYTLKQESSPATGAIGGAALTDPLTGSSWTVKLSSLGGLTLSSISGTPDSAVGFGPEGAPLRTSGVGVSSNVLITLSSGAVLTIDRGSGLTGVTW